MSHSVDDETFFEYYLAKKQKSLGRELTQSESDELRGFCALSQLQIERKERLFDTTVTVRDHFATAALNGLLSSAAETSMIPSESQSEFEWMAEDAYRFADAMLEARKR